MNKRETLDQLVKSRLVFLHTIDGLSESQISQIPVEGTWTVQDLLAHLATWEKACLLPLRSYAAGGAFIPELIPDDLAWNEAQSQIWRRQSFPEILAEYQAVREEIMALMSALPEDRWAVKLPAPWGGEATLAELCSGLIWHESTEHLKSITQWKDTGKPR